METAEWETPHPPKPSSRCPIPAIFLNLEVGLSFSSGERRTHTASLRYASKRMEERLYEERMRKQYEEGRYSQQPPAILTPGEGFQAHRQTRHQQQQERQRRLGVRTTEQHERGTSAPPAALGRTQLLSSPACTRAPSFSRNRVVSYERTNQPLPPTPSQFRLGEADMPWSVPPWYPPSEPESPRGESPVSTVSAISAMSPVEQENNRLLDDPQRVRDLEALHQAMMTVGSLGSDGWEPRSRASMDEISRVPSSVGWAVSSNDAANGPLLSPFGPPPYDVSRWEQPLARTRSRPSTSGA
jgi:hypothetical protein